MSIRTLRVAITAMLALMAITASSASAAISTTAAEWYTGASPGTTLAGDTAVTARIPSGGVTTLSLTLLGEPIELKTSTAECVECKITNEEVTSKSGKVAVEDGKFRFTNVAVVTPANCAIHTAGVAGNGTIETKTLKVHADWMDTTTANQHAFLQFFPATGSVFVGLQFTNKSATEICPIAGSYNITGTLYGESESNTGIQGVEYPIVFSSAVQTTSGASLLVGGNSATLTGTAVFENDGKVAFGIH